MKCSKCKKELIGNQKIKNRNGVFTNGTVSYVTDAVCVLFGGPVSTAIGLGSAGLKLWKKYVKDEMVIKCPHCGTELTLTKAEYKELKKEIEKILDRERKSKQNRIER